ncbi:unnamed protein product, partial [Notodromas monacha]
KKIDFFFSNLVTTWRFRTPRRIFLLLFVPLTRATSSRPEKSGVSAGDICSTRDMHVAFLLLAYEQKNNHFSEMKWMRLTKYPDGGILETEFLKHVLLQTKYSRKEIACELKKVGNFIVKEDSRWVQNVFPSWQNLQIDSESFLGGKRFNSCALVSNSGAIRQSNHGHEIDKHDLIVRMNKAPTKGFEVDVGSRAADLRVINNQVVDAKKHSLKDMEKLLVSLDGSSHVGTDYIIWDHCQCCGIRDFEFCFSGPGKTRIDLTKKLTYDGLGYFLKAKSAGKGKHLFLLDFDFLWNVWGVLQKFYPEEITQHSPSSGFFTVVGLMQICSRITAFEFIPSVRSSNDKSACHYYENVLKCDKYEKGVWHPFEAERSLLYQLNIAEKSRVFLDGVLEIPGLNLPRWLLWKWWRKMMVSQVVVVEFVQHLVGKCGMAVLHCPAHPEEEELETEFLKHVLLQKKYNRKEIACELKKVGNLIRSTDKHDLIVRMNRAPTKGFEVDVGSRPADLRVINSQVVNAKKLSLENVEKLLVSLDGSSHCFSGPGKARIDMENKPTTDGLGYFLKAKSAGKGKHLFLLDFDFLWNVWGVLQKFYPEKITQNTPSTGFIT